MGSDRSALEGSALLYAVRRHPAAAVRDGDVSGLRILLIVVGLLALLPLTMMFGSISVVSGFSRTKVSFRLKAL